jgi:hypothetical protein
MSDKQLEEIIKQHDFLANKDSAYSYYTVIELMKSAIEADRAGRDGKNERLRELLYEWVDIHNAPCGKDHHGYCQEHYLEEDCIVDRSKQALTPTED